MTAHTDDDVERGRAALYANRGRTLTTTEQAQIVLDATAEQIAARAVAKYREALGPVPTLRTPDVEVGSDHGDAH